MMMECSDCLSIDRGGHVLDPVFGREGKREVGCSRSQSLQSILAMTSNSGTSKIHLGLLITGRSGGHILEGKGESEGQIEQTVPTVKRVLARRLLSGQRMLKRFDKLAVFFGDPSAACIKDRKRARPFKKIFDQGVCQSE